jgi:hypothetical protein
MFQVKKPSSIGIQTNASGRPPKRSDMIAEAIQNTAHAAFRGRSTRGIRLPSAYYPVNFILICPVAMTMAMYNATALPRLIPNAKANSAEAIRRKRTTQNNQIA